MNDTPHSDNPKPDEVGSTLKLFEIYRDYVKHEDGLTNQRLLWVLTIHGFLYATYGLIIQKKLEIIASHGLGVYFNCKLSMSIAQIELFLIVIPLVGLSISLVGMKSIAQAHQALFNLHGLFNGQLHDFRRSAHGVDLTYSIGNQDKPVILPAIIGAGDKELVKPGMAAAVVIPLVLAASWLFALLYDGFYIWKNWFGLSYCFS